MVRREAITIRMLAEVGKAEGLGVDDEKTQDAMALRQMADRVAPCLVDTDGDEIRQACARLVENAQRAILRVDNIRRCLDDRVKDRVQVQVGTDREYAIEQLAELPRTRLVFHAAILGLCRPEATEIAVWQDLAMALRIFLVDDHEVVRRGVRDMLEAEDDFEVVGEAGTVEEALNRIPATSPDVAVLDVRLPDGSGVELCREVRSSHPTLACLMLTSFDDDEALFEAIVAGAAGYVLKQVKGNDIVEAVRQVGAGRSLLDPAMTARVMTRLRNGPTEDSRLASLSGQERRILDLLAEGKTNRQIATEIFLAENTVKNYVSNLLTKMGMSRRTEA